MRCIAPLFLFLFLLNACVGGTFGNHADIEEYPLRAANPDEAPRLKRCLNAAFEIEERHRKKTGAVFASSSDLPVDAYCQGLLVSQNRTQDGYEILAQFHEDESTVRWSINQDGVMEEHLEGDEGLGDVDFF